jgi:alkanesulfonate monooxygenase SsuD/methylene tetrahydromethanopterin reductase-like flavin-dependent oxidoreductase (luciferase family)
VAPAPHIPAGALHLAVALDGAGWHPAAWREPDAQPDRLLAASYWVDLAQQAERGLLDFVTIEDSLDLLSDDHLGRDERANEWRARAADGTLSAREVVIEVTGRQSFVGAPETVAAAINERVQADAADGYLLVPHITPDGLAPFVDRVVPLLQERGVFRADYTGSTLRDHLGLAPLGRSDEATGPGERVARAS